MNRTKQKKQGIFFWMYAMVFSFVFFGMFSGEVRAADPISGTYTSAIKDFAFQVGAEALTWTETLPAGTSISVELRAGNISDLSDGMWTAVTKEAPLGESFQGFRYWQYRITLATSDGNFIPSISDISLIGYTGELISSPFRSENYGNTLEKISWTQSGNSSTSQVHFRVRTSFNGSNWTAWCGPNDGGSSCDQMSVFSDSSGGQAIDTLFQSGNDDMWIQYKAIFATTVQEMSSLRLNSVGMEYDRVLWSGTRESIVKDISQIGDFRTISWTENLPNETFLSVQLRAGNTPTPDGTWSSWIPISNGGDISQFTGNRYLQYTVTFSSYDADNIPSISDVTLSYILRPLGTFLLTSSPFNSFDPTNLLSKIEWNETIPPQTNIRFQLRTAPDLTGSPDWNNGSKWCGPTDCALTTNSNDFASSFYETTPQGESTNPIHLEGNNDQWLQYATWLSNENTGATPTLSQVTLTYLVNASPMIQNVTATPNTDKTVDITYEVKDPDTTTGTNTPGFITPSFSYWDGDSWESIASNTLAPEDVQNKAVNQDSYTTHTATWTPSLSHSNLYLSGSAKIRVTIGDNEGANNTANAESNTFTLDTKIPENPSLSIDASTQDLLDTNTTSLLTLSVSEDSQRFMKVSLFPDLSDTDWEPHTLNKTIKLQSDPDTVYAQFKDQYGNETQIIATESIETPSHIMTQDTSNLYLTPPEYRVFLSFKPSEISSQEFSRYELFRKEEGGSYGTDPHDIRTVPQENFLTDSGGGVDPNTLYTYKVRTKDTLGNISFFSQEVTAKANGIQDAGEGGGGVDDSSPSIANVTVESKDTTTVTITWETDELSDSRVEYATTPNTYTKQTGVSTYADTQAQSGLHRVTLTNLTPNTPYFFRVASTDPQGNTGVNDNNGNGYEVTTNPGPSISGVAVSSASNTQATIFWNTNVPADSVLHYSENKNGSLIDPITLSGSSVLTKNHQVTLDALTQGTTYYFYVTSTDSQGNIANDNNGGNYFQFSTTLDETPPTITNLQTSLISNDKAVITANTDEEASFLLQYRKKGSLTFTQTEQGTTYDRSHYRVLDTLTPDTEYEYQVSVKDINQNESQSDIQTMKTTLDPEYNHAPLSKIHTISDPPKVLTDQKAVITFQTDQAANCILEYGTQSRNYQEVPQTEATGIYDTLHSLHLGGLIFNTTYFYKLLCEDNLGTLIESEEKSFTTKLKQVDSGSEQAESTPPSISGVKVKDITGESAVVSWETDEVGNSTIRFGNTKEMENAMSDPLVNSSLQNYTTSHSVTLRGLIPSTKYYYSALSLDTAGNIGTSSQQTFQTQSPSSISSIKASSKQIGETTITWKTSTPTTSIVEYGNTENYGQTRKSEELKKDHEIIINNLLENSTYHFRVKGEDESKNLFSSSDSTFEPKSPPQIKEIKIEVLSDREAKVNFLTDTLTDSLVTYKNKNKEEDQKSEGNPSLLQTHSLTLKELTPGENYVLTVRVRDDMGNETLSDEIEFTMQKDETSPTVERVSTDSALSQNGKVQMIINWQTDEDASSSLIYKEGRAGEEKTVNVSSSPTKNHIIVLTSWKPGTLYSYKVIVKDLSGNETITKDYITLTPQTKESVVELIIKNFKEIFAWTGG
ncbi:MAG: fibronectin type III domain-containing protein [Candidatus Moraniibacteriota bacterium]|nr:MAG: fibronectin type III domain-containing protein [Candidatus Moranbacteria bacterium]